MNKKNIIITVAVLIGLMILFPPITARHSDWTGTRTLNAYSFLLNLPYNSALNISTLLIQIFGALIVGVLAYVSIGKD